MKRNVELDKLLWPKEDLKRILILNYPGCKTASEAVKEIIAKNQTPSAVMSEQEKYKLMKGVIEELTILLKDFDYGLLPDGKQIELKNMPAKTIDEVYAWRDAWKSAVLSAKW